MSAVVCLHPLTTKAESCPIRTSVPRIRHDSQTAILIQAPVRIENEANAAALAEQRFRVRHGVSDFIWSTEIPVSAAVCILRTLFELGRELQHVSDRPDAALGRRHRRHLAEDLHFEIRLGAFELWVLRIPNGAGDLLVQGRVG
jgi:hypothetical protein